MKYLKFNLTILLLVIGSSVHLYSQQSLWVGETYRFDITSSILGITTNMSWSTNGGYISLSGVGLYRDITVTQYYEGSAIVTCEWDYHLYYGGSNTHTKRQVSISCRDNPVTIYPSAMTLSVGQTGYVSYNHRYSNQYTSAAGAFFQSSNPSVCTVSSSGEVVGVGPGTTYICVYSKISSVNSCCKVTVEELKPKNISVSPSDLPIYIGDTYQLHTSFTPSNASSNVSWSSSNSSVASVSSTGLVSALSEGTTVITARTTNNLSAQCRVTVSPIVPTDIIFDPPALKMAAGTSEDLHCSVLPAKASQHLTYRSTNPPIVSVTSEGKITANAEGTAYIQATADNGLMKSCSITVIDYSTLCIVMKSGVKYYHLLSSRPQTYYDGTDYVVEDGKQTHRYEASTIHKIIWESGIRTDLSNITMDKSTILITDGNVLVNNVPADKSVLLYDVSGRLITSEIVNNEGKASISTTPLPMGTYIISICGQTHKFIKQ